MLKETGFIALLLVLGFFNYGWIWWPKALVIAAVINTCFLCVLATAALWKAEIKPLILSVKKN